MTTTTTIARTTIINLKCFVQLHCIYAGAILVCDVVRISCALFYFAYIGHTCVSDCEIASARI